MSGSGGPILTSLPHYDAFRLEASENGSVIREEGSNLDTFNEIPGGDDGDTNIAICHLSTVLPFTQGELKPVEPIFEDSVALALAVHHLNVGDGSIVPEIEGLNKRCPIRFTFELSDTEYEAGVTLGHVVNQAQRDPVGPESLPCAFIGASRSAVSIPTSIVTGVFGYPQISASSTSADLDDTSQYPLFGRTIPSDAGNAIPFIIYFREVLDIKKLAVINVNDAYGNAYVEGLRNAAKIHAPDMEIVQVPFDEGSPDSIVSVVTSVKNTEFRFIFLLVFTIPIHDAIMEEAYNQGIAGTGVHNWLSGDSFPGTLIGRSFEVGSPLALAYQGLGVLEVTGGINGIPDYDNFVTKMQELKNDEDMAYLGSKFPTHDHPNYGTGPPFINDENFLAGTGIKSGFATFVYEAAIAAGMGACSVYANDNTLTLTGEDHFNMIKDIPFTSMSGTVQLDPETGTRDPSSSLYKVTNYVSEISVDEALGIPRVSFNTVVTDLFEAGNWTKIQDFVFNDGTSDLPIDFPAAVSDATTWKDYALFVGPPAAVILLLAAVIFLFYEHKRKQNDAVWKVKKEELIFANPPETIGRGTFGLVLLAEYRGTQVAVKRVIPPKSGKGTKSGGGTSTAGESYASSMEESSEGGERSRGSGNMGMMSGTRSNAMNGKTSSYGLFSTVQRNSPPEQDWKKLKAEFMEEMRYLSKLRHPCVTTVMGAVIGSGTEPMLVMEYMGHGSLYDLLHNETMVIEGELVLPILRDVSQGVRFLHSANPQVVHGDLKAANILVDDRFRAKVADFGLSQKKNLGGTGTPFWMAPELLRGESVNTAETDVFSFGIILYEVYSRRDPYDGENAAEVLMKVADRNVCKRPPVPRFMPAQITALMTDCVEDDPDHRPSFEEIDTRLKRVDAENVDPGQSVKAKEASISLFDIFPRHIAEALRDGRSVEPEHKDIVTIFFSDIIGFTTMSSELDPRKVASLLDRLYTQFDELSRKHDIFKVETIGDAYMAVTNLVKDQKEDHARRIAEFAMDAIQAANNTPIDEDNLDKGNVNIRVGFHSGSVVADVVGTRNPRYCLFGDTVNTASRMESNSQQNRIHCSKKTADCLKEQYPELPLRSRGNITIKGKGQMHTFWVNEVEQPRHARKAQALEMLIEESSEMMSESLNDLPPSTPVKAPLSTRIMKLPITGLSKLNPMASNNTKTTSSEMAPPTSTSSEMEPPHIPKVEPSVEKQFPRPPSPPPSTRSRLSSPPTPPQRQEQPVASASTTAPSYGSSIYSKNSNNPVRMTLLGEMVGSDDAV